MLTPSRYKRDGTEGIGASTPVGPPADPRNRPATSSGWARSAGRLGGVPQIPPAEPTEPAEPTPAAPEPPGEPCVLLKLGEIVLKGRNRQQFEHILHGNISAAARDTGVPVEIRQRQGVVLLRIAERESDQGGGAGRA